VAQSDQPIYHDLNTPEGRRELAFSDEDARRLAGSQVFPLRVRPGDDASCLNLYQPQQPRILGVPKALIDRGGFAWADFLRVAEADPGSRPTPAMQRPTRGASWNSGWARTRTASSASP